MSGDNRISTTSEATSLFVTPKLYDEIVECDKHLIAIESPRVDDIIAQLTENPTGDELMLRRMKKRKLLLKDRISVLERMLEPDEPA